MLDILERAYNAGCFTEVLKLLRAKSSEVLIETVIDKAQQKLDDDDFNFDIFGAD